MKIVGRWVRALLGVSGRVSHRGGEPGGAALPAGAKRAAERVLGADPARDLAALCVLRDPSDAYAALEAVADYVAAELGAAGLRVENDVLPPRGKPMRNVLGWLGDGARPLTIVLAHYDAVPGTLGADDNASGVAALLQAARALAQEPPPGPVLFAATTLEEYGFVGARHLVDRLRREGRTLRGVLDLEMVGYTSRRQVAPPGLDAPSIGDFIAVIADTRSQAVADAFLTAARGAIPALPIEAVVVRNGGRRLPVVRLSDHVPFWDARLPAVMITDTAFLRNPNYHQPSDRPETLDLIFLRRVAAATAAAAWLLASAL